MADQLRGPLASLRVLLDSGGDAAAKEVYGKDGVSPMLVLLPQEHTPGGMCC